MEFPFGPIRATLAGAVMALAAVASGTGAAGTENGSWNGSAKQSGILFRDTLTDGRPCPFCPEMTVIPGGRFAMGSSPGEGHNDERGPHNGPFDVVVSHDLAVGVFEVSRREFSAFVKANPDHTVRNGCAGFDGEQFGRVAERGWRAPGFDQEDSHPVVCVGWADAKAYANWLSAVTGKTYRLLTEAEWEYVARAGTTGRYWWGERIATGRVNCLSQACDVDFARTAPVGTYKPNPFGVFDMLGNVWEWVEDCYDSRAYHKHGAAFPKPAPGPADCNRVIRGGSWGDNPWSLRAANREGWRADVPLNDVGFRLARIDPDVPI